MLSLFTHIRVLAVTVELESYEGLVGRFVMQFQGRSGYGLLQSEADCSSSQKDPPSDDSRCERSQGLKGNVSLGCYFLHLYSSLQRHIPTSLISTSPDCWFLPIPAGSMQWRLWLKGCQRNMTRSLFPSLQPRFIDCHRFDTRATTGFPACCHSQIRIVLHWSTHVLWGLKHESCAAPPWTDYCFKI